MSKEIQLDSQEWCDIVFETKNKTYGAYNMRTTSSDRHIWAFVIVFLFAILIACLPAIISSVRTAIENARPSQNLTESAVLADLKKLEDQVKEENIVRQPEAPPPPPLKSTIQFTAPVMVKADEIADDNQLSQDKLASSKEQISVATVKGTDDIHGIDIADLKEHKVIAEEKKEEEIFFGVEQNPQFPGGEEEMIKFISSNMRYPAIAAENGIEDRVIVRFVVEKDGKVANVEVMRGKDPNLNKEAIRVVSSMPSWQPGRQNGRAVRVYFTLPVSFRLQKN